ncbi:hypothetical protein BKA70DRAFT_1314052, partial [Coprinopsis sp. MPI-PUGE-AT-0042]
MSTEWVLSLGGVAQILWAACVAIRFLACRYTILSLFFPLMLSVNNARSMEWTSTPVNKPSNTLETRPSIKATALSFLNLSPTTMVDTRTYSYLSNPALVADSLVNLVDSMSDPQITYRIREEVQ